MSSAIIKQKSVLAVAITSVLGVWSGHILAADLPPITELNESITIAEADRVYNASGSAITISSGGDSGYAITNNGTIQSDTATAIAISGGAQAGDITNNGTIIGGVGGEQIALDTRGAGNGIKYIMGNGSQTHGNIYLATGNVNSKVETASDATATFDGVKVSGASEFKLGRRSTLILSAQDQSIFMDLQDGGKFYASRDTTLIMELNGELEDDEAVLLINGGFELEDKKKGNLVVRGDVAGAAGTQRLIEADTITGYDDLTVSGGWLISVDSHQLLTDSDGDQYIEAELSYKNATSDELAKMASAGGADATEMQVIETFGDIALDGTKIRSDTITFTSTASEDLADLLNGVSNDAEAAHLAGELTPDRSGAVIHAIHRSQAQQLDNIDQRLALHRNGQQGDGFWLNLYGYQGEKDVNGRIDGYNVNGFSASFGIDKNYSDQIITGLAFGINRQDIDTLTYDTNYIVDDYQLSLYGSFNQDRYFATSAVSAGYSSFVSTRTIGESTGYSGETRAEGDFSSMSIALRMNAGVNYELAKFSIQPLVAAELNHLKINDYQETGSPAALGYDDQSVSQVKLGAGLNISREIKLDSATLSPSLMAMGWYDFNADDEQVNAHILADPSKHLDINDASGASEERYELQAALDYQMDNGGKLGMALGHRIEHDYSDTRLQFQYRYSF